MELARENEKWIRTDEPNAGENQFYYEPILRYLNCLDPLFSRAKDVNEFEFLMTLFGPRSTQDAGWDPFESTREAFSSVTISHKLVKGYAKRHLELWLYGHILEASEPYEIIANLLGIIDGETFKTQRFEPHKGGREKSPGEKINELKNLAKKIKMPDVIIPLNEAWNKNLRNSIFHADYSLYGSEVRTCNPSKIYTHEEIATLSNRALAYFEALCSLFDAHISSYEEPKIIDVPDYFSEFPKAVVLVSEGYGAIGMQAAFSKKEVAQGHILWRLGVFSQDEIRSLETKPTKWLLPKRPEKSKISDSGDEDPYNDLYDNDSSDPYSEFYEK